MLAGEGLCSRTGGVQPSAIPIWWELCQGGNSPQLHFQRAHRGLGNHLSFPPHTPLKNEPWRRGRASSCKCHSISPCPLLPCSLYLRCPSPAKMTMLTSGEPAAARSGQQEREGRRLLSAQARKREHPQANRAAWGQGETWEKPGAELGNSSRTPSFPNIYK